MNWRNVLRWEGWERGLVRNELAECPEMGGTDWEVIGTGWTVNGAA
jgi:hypothetical protein